MADRPEVEAAREKLASMLAARMCGACKAYKEHQELADAILSAFPQIAPTEDVVEAARNIAHRATVGCDAPVTEGHIYDCTKLTNWIAAALTAHAAREREADIELITAFLRRLEHPDVDEGAIKRLAAAIRARKP